MRETKFSKFSFSQAQALQARAVGAPLSAFSAKRASLFLLKRGGMYESGRYYLSILGDNKACGFFSSPLGLLKLVKSVISVPLATIVNQSI